MKRNILFSITLLIAVVTILPQNTSAQKKGEGASYTNAIGLGIDLGSDFGTYAGISGKHFFNENVAGEMEILFGNSTVILQPAVQYHGAIPNAEGLKWFVGIGPGFAFGSGYSDVMLRPMVGLDYKINQVPINFGFDWRPTFFVTHGSHFTPARFGLAMRYAF